MAISVKGKLAEKVTELLGGKNVTEKRIEGLLAELEESRAALAAYKAIHEPEPTLIDPRPVQTPRTPPASQLGDLAVPILTAGLTEGELADVEDDPEDAEPSPEDPAVLARHLGVQPIWGVRELGLSPDVGNARLLGREDADRIHEELTKAQAASQPAPPSPTLSPEMQAMQAMMEMVQVLKAEVQALKAPATEKDKKEAIADGKLPAVVAPAGPTGYTGSAQLPRGKWLNSPLGPSHIKIRLCDCPKCTPFRVHHFYCCICHRGPLLYAGQTGPKGRKTYVAPGSTWGITHEACSVTCWMRYLEQIGVAPGINDSEPMGVAQPDEQPVPALGSD